MKFVFASDSFKGTLSSRRTAALLTEAAKRHFPSCECISVPMADGGEGTVDAIVAATGGSLRTVRASGPLGDAVDASFGVLCDGRAVIEMSAASGLCLLRPEQRNPLLTSTFGTGELIRAALDEGVRDVTLALGGSATNDAGMGCMRALGVRFLDARGEELAGVGADLGRVCAIDASSIDPRVAQTHFTLMCDVDNPLVGPTGASQIYATQKGANPEQVNELEVGMCSFAAVLEREFGRSFDVSGAGAAGGLAAGCLAFLNARIQSGVERVLELANFDELLLDADLCVTGEGQLDAQTSHGKVVAGVAAACERAGVPCVAVVGGWKRADTTSAAEASGADRSCNLPGLVAVVPTVTGPMPLQDALDCADELYALAADRLFSLLATGASLRGRSQGETR